jgi:pimeloyl-ACP methyl ester carboxylesterase
MKEQFININGVKTFTRIAGEGSPFLILHGWGRGHISWIGMQDNLSRNFQVITLDLPGFGKSDMPPTGWGVSDYVRFVLDFARKLDIDRFHLLGQSFGGRLCIKLAAHYPERIKKLILVDSAGIKHKKSFFETFGSSMASIFKVFSFLPGYQLSRKFFYRFVLKRPNYLEATGTKKETLIKVLKEDITPYLEKIDVPTLIVWGRRDKLIPLKDGYLMKERIKNSELKIFDCGHAPHDEIPDILVKTI